MKMKQKGIATAAIAVVVIVVIAVAGVGAFLVLRGRGPGVGTRNATATVRLHDAETIDIAEWAEDYMPDMPGVSITVSGTVTVNSFSATNVTVKLHNKDTGEWITIIENQTITDLIVGDNFVEEISSGTYDKVSIYIGTITVSVEWTDIVISYTVDLSQYGFSGTFSGEYNQPAGSFSQSVTINQEFVINLEPEVTVDVGKNQVFDVDTNCPFDMDSSVSGAGVPSFRFNAGALKRGNMKARGI